MLLKWANFRGMLILTGPPAAATVSLYEKMTKRKKSRGSLLSHLGKPLPIFSASIGHKNQGGGGGSTSPNSEPGHPVLGLHPAGDGRSQTRPFATPSPAGEARLALTAHRHPANVRGPLTGGQTRAGRRRRQGPSALPPGPRGSQGPCSRRHGVPGPPWPPRL